MIRHNDDRSLNWPSSDISEDDPDSLAHFGVKGMKWGVRKDRKNSVPRDPESQFLNEVRNQKASSLSNEDLRRASNRLQLEVTYDSLRKQQQSQTLGRRMIRKVGTKMGDKVASTIANAAVAAGMKYASQGIKYLLKTRAA